MWSAVLTRLEVVVAVVIVVGALKSAYNGTVRGLVDNIQEIPAISDRVEEIGDRQERMVDGMVALSVAENEDQASVDTDRLADDLRDGTSYRVYLSRPSGYGTQRGYAEEEEEEEEVEGKGGRWRVRRDGE